MSDRIISLAHGRRKPGNPLTVWIKTAYNPTPRKVTFREVLEAHLNGTALP